MVAAPGPGRPSCGRADVLVWECRHRPPTTYAILRRHDLGRLDRLEPRPPVARYERPGPASSSHLDTKQLGRIFDRAAVIRRAGARPATTRAAGPAGTGPCRDDDHSSTRTGGTGRSRPRPRPPPSNPPSVALLCRPWYHDRADPDRQWRLLPQLRLCDGLRRARHRPSLYAALSTPDQRQGRTDGPDPPQRVGLRSAVSTPTSGERCFPGSSTSTIAVDHIGHSLASHRSAASLSTT